MVFHRRAAEGESMRASQQAHGFGRFCSRVFDGLRFVEHEVIELDVFESSGVAAQSAVCRQHQIVAGEIAHAPRCAGVIEHAQLRSEALGFLLPIEDQ
jgi:hypothetical protein